MLKDAEDIVKLWRAGARAYVCGSRPFAEGVTQAAGRIALQVRDRMEAQVREQRANGKIDGQQQVSGFTEDEKVKMEERFRMALQQRLASDVFD